jgi:SAM-dependent methyltransferase
MGNRGASNSKAHWEAMYRARDPEGMSWYQPEAGLSLDLIGRVAPPPAPAVLDVGGGASPLVDGLLAAGYRRVTVLDLSGVALEAARRRLGQDRAATVDWREADVLEVDFPQSPIDSGMIGRCSTSSRTQPSGGAMLHRCGAQYGLAGTCSSQPLLTTGPRAAAASKWRVTRPQHSTRNSVPDSSWWRVLGKSTGRRRACRKLSRTAFAALTYQPFRRVPRSNEVEILAARSRGRIWC